MSEDDQRIINDTRLQLSSGRVDAIWNKRDPLMSQVSSEGGKRELILLLFEAACLRRDVVAAGSYHNRLERFGRAVQQKGDATCRKSLPDQTF